MLWPRVPGRNAGPALKAVRRECRPPKDVLPGHLRRGARPFGADAADLARGGHFFGAGRAGPRLTPHREQSWHVSVSVSANWEVFRTKKQDRHTNSAWTGCGTCRG